MPDNKYVLVLYYSSYKNTLEMAKQICNGVDSIKGIEAVLRTVPDISPTNSKKDAPIIPESGSPYASIDELENCSGLILGSPTRFGNMASQLKYFLDQTTSTWLSGKLAGKPAGCFTSTGSLHGGMETTIISMLIPLMHHGMIIAGVPYTESSLISTKSGGTPYGPSHLAGGDGSRAVDADEKKICIAFGKRIAQLALKLS
ncbi:MAG: NAD(P)H:quinone oxidoreductase [Pseudomonadota bacterium]|nr:NAD(P)H:quinone oxidoreductase [Pseudomonadota bacterium]